MHVAFLTTVLPEARGGGGEVVSQAFVDALREGGHQVSVVGYARPGARIADPGALSAGVRPIETSDAGGRDRARWLATALVRRLPYSAAKYVSRDYAERARAALREADVCVVDHAQTGWLLDDLRAAGKPLVLLAHNVEAALYEGRGSGLRGAVFAREARLIGALEAALVAVARQVWTITADDGVAFARQAPGRVRTFAVPGVASEPGAGEPEFDVGLIGSWTWGPNLRGLEWFLDRVLPSLPGGTSVHVAGRGAEVAGGRNGVTVRGFVPDAGAFIGSARVLAIPALAGAGVQVKTLDAIGAGWRVVATPLALRGIEEPPPTVAVAADAAAFAARLAEASAAEPDPELRSRAVAWARRRAAAFLAALAEATESLSSP